MFGGHAEPTAPPTPPKLAPPGQRRGTRSSTLARVGDNMVEGGHLVLRRSNTRGHTPARRRCDASSDRSRSPVCQPSPKGDRVVAEDPVSAPALEEPALRGWRATMAGRATRFLRGG